MFVKHINPHFLTQSRVSWTTSCYCNLTPFLHGGNLYGSESVFTPKALLLMEQGRKVRSAWVLSPVFGEILYKSTRGHPRALAAPFQNWWLEGQEERASTRLLKDTGCTHLDLHLHLRASGHGRHELTRSRETRITNMEDENVVILTCAVGRDTIHYLLILERKAIALMCSIVPTYIYFTSKSHYRWLLYM